ncbi:MAG: type I pullulanase, partial [Ruminococcus sp.]|nr:type I pullulanase [Ruminococcus sp.]
MKIRRMISVVLAVLMLASLFTVAASAADSDVAETGAANSSYLENYAKAAVESGETLGAVYTPAATTFKVWAPEAESVMVKMFTTGTDAESGASTVGTFPMTYNSSTGIWTLTKSGDFKDKYYTYLVTRSGVVKETVDPYAKAVGANGDRGMVVDLDSTDPDGWDKDSHVLFSNPGDAVVWEIHVRDFSIDVSSGVSEANRGKYLAFTEGNTTVNGAGKIASCVDYLVEHNVNCVQLMPIEDFASIDETDARVNRNWGYDPKNYNVPEGSYSSDPYNGNTRITEFKMLVQALHDRGISVVMDVVYNHTFVREGSPFSKTVPKYYYRMSNMNTNSYNNGSGLGNVLSTEKAMTRKFVQDSLVYWATEYHVDGFRFDLMGCHDRPAVQAWRTALDKVDSRILMYGEPWAGGSDNGISNAVSKSTMSQLTRVGAFNEGYSDALKGSHETATGTGFLNGGAATEILKAAGGTATDFSGAKVEQFINYTDNHDNWTLFDKILAANKTANFKTAKDDLTLYDK